jgi:hypothetical protein
MFAVYCAATFHCSLVTASSYRFQLILVRRCEPESTGRCRLIVSAATPNQGAALNVKVTDLSALRDRVIVGAELQECRAPLLFEILQLCHLLLEVTDFQFLSRVLLLLLLDFI